MAEHPPGHATKISANQFTGPGPLHLRGEQEEDQMQSPRRLPVELEVIIVSYLPLDLDETTGWRNLNAYMRVCHAWTDLLRKHIARDVPLSHLVRNIRDAEIVNAAVEREIAHAQTLPDDDVPAKLNAIAEYIVLGAFPEALRLVLDAGAKPDYMPYRGGVYATLLNKAILGKVPRILYKPILELEGIRRRVDGDRLECVRLLIAKGSDIEARSCVYGHEYVAYTPLAVAVTEEQSDIIVELLNHGANTSVVVGPHYHPVFLPYYCALKGDISLLSKLLRHGDADARAAAFQQLVDTTIYAENMQVFDMLLQLGFPIQESENWKETPLEMAANIGNAQIITKLVNLGANVHNRELLGTCAHRAPLKTIETLVHFKAPVTPFVYYAMADWPEKIDFLLQCDPLIGTKGLMNQWMEKPMRTPCIDTAALLRVALKHGADPNTQVDGIPGLSMCIRDRSCEECELLLQGGADPNPKVPQKSMPLYFAVTSGSITKIQLLRRFGAIFTACPEAEHFASLMRLPSKQPSPHGTSLQARFYSETA